MRSIESIKLLDGVDLTGITTNQILQWDGTDWNMHKNSSGNTQWSFRDALSLASDGRNMGNLGMSVSSDGNRVIVSTSTSDIISTWDYTPSGSASWTMTPGYLTPPYTGYTNPGSVRLSDDGNTFIIGVHQQGSGSGQSNAAQGNVFVYSWNSGTSTWTLKGSNLPIVGSSLTGGEYLGYNVSISSDGNRISFGNFEMVLTQGLLIHLQSLDIIHLAPLDMYIFYFYPSESCML